MLAHRGTGKEKERTLANRQISAPVDTSVNRISSPTQVTIFDPSGVTATGPEVYNGAIVRAFLKLEHYEH